MQHDEQRKARNKEQGQKKRGQDGGHRSKTVSRPKTRMKMA